MAISPHWFFGNHWTHWSVDFAKDKTADCKDHADNSKAWREDFKK